MKKIYKFLFRGPTEFFGPVIMQLIFLYATILFLFWLRDANTEEMESMIGQAFFMGIFARPLCDIIGKYFKKIGKEDV